MKTLEAFSFTFESLK